MPTSLILSLSAVPHGVTSISEAPDTFGPPLGDGRRAMTLALREMDALHAEVRRQ